MDGYGTFGEVTVTFDRYGGGWRELTISAVGNGFRKDTRQLIQAGTRKLHA
jgi:hypothetical protein